MRRDVAIELEESQEGLEVLAQVLRLRPRRRGEQPAPRPRPRVRGCAIGHVIARPPALEPIPQIGERALGDQRLLPSLVARRVRSGSMMPWVMLLGW